jgi:hypothetical protein
MSWGFEFVNAAIFWRTNRDFSVQLLISSVTPDGSRGAPIALETRCIPDSVRIARSKLHFEYRCGLMPILRKLTAAVDIGLVTASKCLSIFLPLEAGSTWVLISP